MHENTETNMNFAHIFLKLNVVVSTRGQWHYRTSVAKSSLGFEISDLSYLYIHVRIVDMVPYSGLRGHCSLQTASEVIFGLNNLHFICDLSLPLPYITSSLNFPRRENDPNHHLPLLRLKFRGPRLRCRYRAARNNAHFYQQ